MENSWKVEDSRIGENQITNEEDGYVVQYYEYSSSKNRDCDKKINYLICCPGWLCSPISIRDCLKDITNKADYTLIVIEWRGHGKSTVSFVSSGVTISLLSGDLNTLVQHFRKNSPTSKISLLGHSMGVNVIWRYIERFGEKNIDRYIFLDQPAAITGSTVGEKLGYRKEWRVHSQMEVYTLAFLCLLKNYLVIPILQLFSSPRWMRGNFLDYAKQCNSLACSRLLIDTTFTDNTQRISLVKRPCLVYGGEVSFVKPDVSRWIASRVQGPVRLLIYPEPYGTHFPFFSVEKDLEQEGPRRLVKDISEYLVTDSPL